MRHLYVVFLTGLGAGDGDPQDFDQAPLVVIGLIVLIVLIGGMVLLSGWRRRRGPRE